MVFGILFIRKRADASKNKVGSGTPRCHYACTKKAHEKSRGNDNRQQAKADKDPAHGKQDIGMCSRSHRESKN